MAKFTTAAEAAAAAANEKEQQKVAKNETQQPVVENAGGESVKSDPAPEVPAPESAGPVVAAPVTEAPASEKVAVKDGELEQVPADLFSKSTSEATSNSQRVIMIRHLIDEYCEGAAAGQADPIRRRKACTSMHTAIRLMCTLSTTDFVKAATYLDSCIGKTTAFDVMYRFMYLPTSKKEAELYKMLINLFVRYNALTDKSNIASLVDVDAIANMLSDVSARNGLIRFLKG